MATDAAASARDQGAKATGKLKEAWSGSGAGAKLQSLQSAAPNGLPVGKAALKPAKKAKAAGKGGVPPVLLGLTAVVGLLFVASLGPMLAPKAFGESAAVAKVQKFSPMLQAALGVLLLALIALLFLSSKKKKAQSATNLPAGVKVGPDGVLVDESGNPLPRGLKLSPDGSSIVTATGAALPAGVILGAGGVLMHSASGRPIPHSCSLGQSGELLSSTGQALPDSMSVGPNCTLVAADGVVMSPDLQEVPQGFKISSCSKYLLRPNGKPVPRGVHVGPGFRLLKPTGETLPDGVKIGPCGTIICLDDTILGPDGSPLPAGFKLNPDKTQIIDPEGAVIDDSYNMGPNGTLITKDDTLVTAIGRAPLSKAFTLGPLGQLLMRGKTVPAHASWSAEGKLVSPDGSVLSEFESATI